jgi:SagB-type dehydrogenase family enzyme
MRTVCIVIFGILFVCLLTAEGNTMNEEKVILPDPSQKGKMSVGQAIGTRRTVRDFKSAPLTMPQLSQLLWAAQGITDENREFRAAPSAGALYPLDVYVVVASGGVSQLDGGIYHYLPREHALRKILAEDRRRAVAEAALGQQWIAGAPVVFVLTAEYRRITGKYGKRGVRYAHIEAGHVGQNIFLQAEALGLGAGIVGAFDDSRLARVIEAANEHEPLLIMPVGYKK